MIDNVDELYIPLVDPFVQRVTADIYAFRHCDGTSQNPSCVAITSKNDEASAHTRQTLFVGVNVNEFWGPNGHLQSTDFVQH